MAPSEVRHGEYGEPYTELAPLGWVIAGPLMQCQLLAIQGNVSGVRES